MNSKYVTHARSLEELKNEFISDLNRRVDSLDLFIKNMSPSAIESSRIARAKIELQKAINFWSNVELRGAKKRQEEDRP